MQFYFKFTAYLSSPRHDPFHWIDEPKCLVENIRILMPILRVQKIAAFLVILTTQSL